MSASTAKVNDLSWMIGGPQGSGVDSSANVFARACAAGGLHIFGKREFYSNIMGEHSYFALRAHSGLVRSHIDDVNVLATFEAETLFRHAREVTDDGAIIYDPSLGKTRLSDIPTIEKRLAADLKTYFIARGVGETLACGTGACAVAVVANESGRIHLGPLPRIAPALEDAA